MRLIDADALEKEVNSHTKSITPIENDRDMFYHDTGWNGETTAARVAIHHAPTVDAVVVRHGTWRNSDFVSGMLACNQCGAQRNPKFKIGGGAWNYCPNCGAKMDGERATHE